jgi:hypothetical protein
VPKSKREVKNPEATAAVSRFLNRLLRTKEQEAVASGQSITALSINIDEFTEAAGSKCDQAVIARRMRRRGFAYVAFQPYMMPAHGSPYDTEEMYILLARYSRKKSDKESVVLAMVDLLWPTSTREFTLPFRLDVSATRRIQRQIRRSSRRGAQYYHLAIERYSSHRYAYRFPHQDGSGR